MAKLFKGPLVQSPRGSTGVKDPSVSRALRSLEDAVGVILERLARAEVTDATPVTGTSPIVVTSQDVSLTTSGVTAGSYTSADITVDAHGLITAAASGGSGSGPSGFVGDGSDGAATLDGTTTVLGMTPSSSVYIATRDLFFTDLTIDSGVTLQPSGWRIFVNGTLTLNGTITASGHDASGATGGLATGAGFLGAGGSGGSGAVNSGSATSGGVSAHVPREFASGATATANNGPGADGGVGQGGSGGDKSGGGAGRSGLSTTTLSLQNTHDIFVAMQGHGWGDGSALTGGSGGGGGRGDGFTGSGGGGGGGGGWVVVCAHEITGSGSITANGGAGANGVSADGSGGGGGGGGVVVVVIDKGSFPTTSAAGGLGGAGTGSGFTGGDGGDGLKIFYKVG